jgi:ribulokinase
MDSPSSPPYVLCLDGGTESIRAGIFDRTGGLLSASSCPYATRFPQPGWAEQDPGEWQVALMRVVKECLAKAPVRAADIRGICLDATTCTLLALDADGRPLLPAFLWMDVRAAAQAERIFATHHPALAYSPAGCNAEWMLGKVLWLAENEPEIYARTAHFVEYTDWLVYQLTGKLVLNLNTVTQRWFYNGRAWKFPTSLYDQLGLPDLTGKIPPDVIPAGQPIGRLLPEIAQAVGLSEGTAVYQGGGDAFIGLLGLNVTRPGKIGLITGSSNVLAGFAATDREFHPSGLYGAFPDAVVPGLWLVEGGQSSTGANLAWFKRNFAQDLPDSQAYQMLDREAADVPPGAGGLVALDYFQGNRTPYTDSKGRGAMWGLSLSTSRGQIFRALMESIAFGSRLILEALAEGGSPVDQVYACGGATHSDLFMQIYADVCGIPISVVKVADAPLVGDAVLAFTGLGVYPNLVSAAEAMVKFDRHYQPNPQVGQEYQFYFELYKDTYHQLKSLMHRLSDHLGN